MRKIDIHLHCAGNERAPMGHAMLPSWKDLREDVFPQTETERGILMTAPGDPLAASAEDYRRANEASRTLAEKYADRLAWMCCLDPREPELAGGALDDTLRKYQSEGAVGFGEACAPMWIDDPEMQRVFRCLEELGLPVLMHMAPKPMSGYGLADDPGLPRLEKMLKAYPKLIFIGHSQIFWSEIAADCPPEQRAEFPSGRVSPGRIAELMETYPNLYADLSAMSGYNALARDLAHAAAFLNRYQDRLMYGSDYLIPRFGIHTAALLDGMAELGILSREAAEKICRKNAQCLFGL